MLISTLINEIHDLLEKEVQFHILLYDDDLLLIKKPATRAQMIQSATLFFKASLKELKTTHITSAKILRKELLKLHTSWFSQFRNKKESLSDRLCALAMLYEELVRYGKVSLGDWVNVDESEVFEKNPILYDSLNRRYDLGPFILVEMSCKGIVLVPLNQIRRRSNYTKSAKLSGFDFYYNETKILCFDKEGKLLKGSVDEKGVIRDVQ
jgi:hypothetical protein